MLSTCFFLILHPFGFLQKRRIIETWRLQKRTPGILWVLRLFLLSNIPHQKIPRKTVMSCPAPLFSKHESVVRMVSSPAFFRYFKNRQVLPMCFVCQNASISIPMVLRSLSSSTTFPGPATKTSRHQDNGCCLLFLIKNKIEGNMGYGVLQPFLEFSKKHIARSMCSPGRNHTQHATMSGPLLFSSHIAEKCELKSGSTWGMVSASPPLPKPKRLSYMALSRLSWKLKLL